MRCELSDPVGVYQPAPSSRQMAGEIAAELGWNADWFPDALLGPHAPQLPLELEALTISAGRISEVLALLLASPEPRRHGEQIRAILAHAGVGTPEDAARLALETYDRYGINVGVEAILPDLASVLR
jgi:hypothetical protein